MPEDRTISVTVNGKIREVSAGLTVDELLEALGLNPTLVVVERNREILDRSGYTEVPVEAGDVLELVHFVGGG
jgi:thiamine biosynthesis protein ThiS